jgi:hypothetical protein
VLKPGDAYASAFCTQRFDTGAATDADAPPTAAAYRNGAVDAAFVLTVANVSTGLYKITGTVPVGYAAGDLVHVVVSATVNAVAGKAVVDSFGVDTVRASEVPLGTWDVLAASVGAANTIGLQVKTDLDATISSRSTFAGGAVASVTGAVGSVTGLNAALLDASVAGVPAATQALVAAGPVASVAGAVGSVTGSVGSVVGLTVGNLDVAVSTRSSHTAAQVQALVAAGAVASVTGSVGSVAGNVVGSVGSVAGLTPGNLDVAVSTRLATTGYTAPDNASAVTAAAQATTAATQATAAATDAAGAHSDTATLLTRVTEAVPNAAAIATAVWAATTRTLTSLSALLAGISADVWGYASRTLTSTGTITVVGPVATSGAVTIVHGDDYSASDARQLDWTATDWPDLTGATITLHFAGANGYHVDITGSVVASTPTSPQKVRVALTSAQTTLLPVGAHRFDVSAALAVSARVVTLVRDSFTVLADY